VEEEKVSPPTAKKGPGFLWVFSWENIAHNLKSKGNLAKRGATGETARKVEARNQQGKSLGKSTGVGATKHAKKGTERDTLKHKRGKFS